MSSSQQFKVIVEEVHSGDDLVLMVDLGIDNLYKRVRARLQGVDTPDAYQESSDTEAGKVRERVRRLVQRKACLIDLHTIGKGGWVVTLYLLLDNSGNTMNINDVLRSEGHVYLRAERKVAQG